MPPVFLTLNMWKIVTMGRKEIFVGLILPLFLLPSVTMAPDRLPVEMISLAKVLLSKDQLADDSDFILREFNLGGDGIGFGMLAGETINLTWFQQLPDNYEGDYYLILEINNRGTVEPPISLDTTPIFSLSSQDKGRTDLLSLGNTADSVCRKTGALVKMAQL